MAQVQHTLCALSVPVMVDLISLQLVFNSFQVPILFGLWISFISDQLTQSSFRTVRQLSKDQELVLKQLIGYSTIRSAWHYSIH